MSLEAFPLNDRKYSVKDFMMTLGGRKSGVLTAENDNLKVVLNSTDDRNGYAIKVKAGKAYLSDGFDTIAVDINDDVVLNIDGRDTQFDRIDRVALCWDIGNLSVLPTLMIIKGEATSDPVPKDISDFTFTDGQPVDVAIVLAQIRVKAGYDNITDDDITDTRLDDSLCGLSYDKAFYDYVNRNFENKDSVQDKVDAVVRKSRIVEQNIPISPTNGKVVLNVTHNGSESVHLKVGEMAVFGYSGNAEATVYAPPKRESVSEMYVAIMEDHCGVNNAGKRLFDVGKEISHYEVVESGFYNHDDPIYETKLKYTPKNYQGVRLLLVRIN